MSLYSLFHPHVFQGRKRKTSYFEGWYFKMAKEGRVLAIIPGVAFGESEMDRHAFIQVFTNMDGKSRYVSYPFDSFHADDKELDITIGKNRFTRSFIDLDIESDTITLKGRIDHDEIHPFPVTLAAPGIMGWYAYVPFMECFHGVVSTYHGLKGVLRLDDRPFDFTDGNGYIEKDWGTSFPRAWIWMQSNGFPSKDISCMLSVAEIPFLGRVFTGFLGFVQVGNRLIRFGTYTGAKITTLEVSDREAKVVIEDGHHIIKFTAETGSSAHLAAPRQGKMERKILESLEGRIALHIFDKRSNMVILEDVGLSAGVELSEADRLSTER